MTSILEKGMSRRQLVRTSAQTAALGMKGFGSSSLIPGGGLSQFGDHRQQTQNRRRYNLFRGWVHAAIHALAESAAGQEVKLGRLKTPDSIVDRKVPNSKTMYHKMLLKGMPDGIRTKMASDDFEIITDHGILDLMEKPNPIQYRWQYTYTFIANLCLTGFGYIVSGVGEDGLPELYSLPTTWIRPIHDKGPFTQFKIVDPNNPTAESNDEDDLLDRSQVAFAQIPDPSNPLASMPMAAAQTAAINIDDKIQSSQTVFFDNGIFPSVVITMGKNPHPDVPANATRPRLSPKQRRQVESAIRKTSSGVANYGNPAIVDGLIERIDKLSMTNNEMGWDKSEKSAKRRILSAFGIHPFILGEEMVGSEAQARIVYEHFFAKVNTFLDLLSTISSDFVPKLFPKAEKGLTLWYEKKVAVNPATEQDLWKTARANGDVTQDEFRSYMNLAPDEDLNQNHIDKSQATAVTAIATAVTAGGLDPEQGQAILVGMGLPEELAESIAGDGVSEDAVMDELGGAVGALETAVGGGEPAAKPAAEPAAVSEEDDMKMLEELLS